MPERKAEADKETVQGAVGVARGAIESAREAARVSKAAEFDGKDLKWLAIEALEVSRAWGALANDLLARTPDGKEQVAELKERGQRLQAVEEWDRPISTGAY